MSHSERDKCSFTHVWVLLISHGYNNMTNIFELSPSDYFHIGSCFIFILFSHVFLTQILNNGQKSLNSIRKYNTFI